MRIIRSATLKLKDKIQQRNLILAVSQVIIGFLFVSMPTIGFIPSSQFIFWLVIVLGLGLMLSGAWFGMVVASASKKRHTQERLSQILEQTLGDEFIYFRNLTLPGQRSVGEIDGVLLGPPGAVVLQVENYQGEYAIEGDTWYRYTNDRVVKAKPKPMSRIIEDTPLEARRRLDDSPTWVAIRAAREVKAWLSVRGLPQVVVHPLVVLGSGKIRTLKQPSAPAVELHEVEPYIKQTLFVQAKPVEPEELIEQIAQRLQTNGN